MPFNIKNVFTRWFSEPKKTLSLRAHSALSGLGQKLTAHKRSGLGERISVAPIDHVLIDAASPATPSSLRKPGHEKFNDSVSIHTFKPKLRLGAGSEKTAVFDQAFSAAITSYRPEADEGLVAAGGRSPGRPLSDGVTLDRLSGANTHQRRAAAVAARLSSNTELGAWYAKLLTKGVGTAIGPANESLIRPVQALSSAMVLTSAPAAVRTRIVMTLAAANNELEQALIMKSLGPRATSLLHSDPEKFTPALAEIEAYAAMIRGAPQSLLLERASMLTSGKWGVDSLKQQAANTCVAASTLVCMGTADPILSWLLKADGKIDAANPVGLGARLERAILTSDLSGERGDTWDVPKSAGAKHVTETLVTEARRKGQITEQEAAAFDALRYPSSKLASLGLPSGIDTVDDLRRFRQIQAEFKTHFAEADATLAKMRLLQPGSPKMLFDGPTLLEWGTFSNGRPKGIGPEVAGTTFLSGRTHLSYNRVKYRYRLEADPKHVDRLFQVVDAGQPTLLRRGNPEDLPTDYSHCLVALDCRGEPGSREFLVTDSSPGKASWVSQKSFDYSYFFGHSHPTLGVGRRAAGRPEL